MEGRHSNQGIKEGCVHDKSQIALWVLNFVCCLCKPFMRCGWLIILYSDYTFSQYTTGFHLKIQLDQNYEYWLDNMYTVQDVILIKFTANSLALPGRLCE